MGFGSLNLKETLIKRIYRIPELFLNRKIGILRKHDISVTSALGITGKDKIKENPDVWGPHVRDTAHGGSSPPSLSGSGSAGVAGVRTWR